MNEIPRSFHLSDLTCCYTVQLQHRHNCNNVNMDRNTGCSISFCDQQLSHKIKPMNQSINRQSFTVLSYYYHYLYSNSFSKYYTTPSHTNTHTTIWGLLSHFKCYFQLWMHYNILSQYYTHKASDQQNAQYCSSYIYIIISHRIPRP